MITPAHIAKLRQLVEQAQIRRTDVGVTPAVLGALLDERAELLTELHRMAEYLSDASTDMGCSAGNFDGGSQAICEHCQLIEWVYRLDRLAGQP